MNFRCKASGISIPAGRRGWSNTGISSLKNDKNSNS